jgi:hypothetical protein
MPVIPSRESLKVSGKKSLRFIATAALFGGLILTPPMFFQTSSEPLVPTNGSVVRLNANSANPLQLRGPQASGGDTAYVNTGLIQELGRQTAPIPKATGLFIVGSLAGGYNIAMVGGPLVLADAAAFALVAADNMGSAIDAQVMATSSTQYQNATNPGSIRNVKTDVQKPISSRTWKLPVTKSREAAMRPFSIMGLTATQSTM